MQNTEAPADDWGPATDLWAAVILVDGQNAPDCTNVVLKQLTWASRDEAIGYLERNLLNTTIPEDLSNRDLRSVVGHVRPARLITMWCKGEIVGWTELFPIVDAVAEIVVDWTLADRGDGIQANVRGSRRVRLINGPRPVAVAA